MIERATIGSWSLVVGLSAIAHGAVLLPTVRGLLRDPAPLGAETQPPTPQVDVDLESPAPVAPSEALPNHPDVAPPTPVAASRQMVHFARPGATSATAAAPAAVVASPDAPQFTMAVTATTLDGSGGGEAQAKTGINAGSAQAADDAPLSAGAVDTPARLVHGEVPSYPLEAREDGLQADVPLELIVSREGTVESAQVLRRAGHGLDDAAAAAARHFRFTPALKQGRAVRVRVAWTVEFRLHGS